MTDNNSDFIFSHIELADYLHGQPAVVPLVLRTDQMEKTFTSTPLTLPDASDYGMVGNGPIQTDGNVLRAVIPFTGDPILWQARPEGIGYGPQPRGAVDAKEQCLTLTFSYTDNITSNWYARALQMMLDVIQTYINYQAAPLARHNAALVEKG